MQINWFTVIAQIVNFIVLVWLLKRFLYKPILKAIDERENKIAAQIRDAEAKDANAKKEQIEFAKKNERFDKEKKKLMDKAISETNEEKEKLLEAARDEAAELRTKLEISQKEMQKNLNRDIGEKTQQAVFAIARKALADLASLGLEEQITAIFLKRIHDLSKEEKKQFLAAFKTSSTSILIQSAFDMSMKQQNDIKNTVNEILGTKTQYQFKTAPDIISGIELTSNGYKLAWSISEYLNSLQKNISETQKSKTLKDKTKVVPQKKSLQKPKKVPAKEAGAGSEKPPTAKPAGKSNAKSVKDK